MNAVEIEQMSNADGSNTHEVISELFRAMYTPIKDGGAANLPRWADVFPYVNGGLFSGRTDAPVFSRTASDILSGHYRSLCMRGRAVRPDAYAQNIATMFGGPTSFII